MSDSTNGDDQGRADWPDRFVYLCTATGSEVVNIEPLRQAPPGSVVGLVILRALSAPGALPPTRRDESDAIRPHHNLVTFAKDRLRLAANVIEPPIDGQADSFPDFAAGLDRAVALARRLGAEVVFNVTGGRVAAKFGPLLGYVAAPDDPAVHILNVGMAPAAAYLVSVNDDGTVSQRPLPYVVPRTLVGHLRTAGIELSDPDGERRNQTLAELGEPAAQWLLDHAGAGGLDALHGAIGGLPKKVKYPRVLEVSPGAYAVVEGVMDRGAPLGVTLTPPVGVTLRQERARDFLGGRWLETLIYRRLKRALDGIGGLDWLLGADLRNLGDGAHDDIGDIDVGVFAAGQLFIVEAKAGSNAAGLNRAVQQLSPLGVRVVGPAGGFWIVAPRANPADHAVVRAAQNTTENSIELLAGPGALDQLDQKLRARVLRAMTYPV